MLMTEEIDGDETRLLRRDPVAQRVLMVLETCASVRRPLSVTEVVHATGIAKSTVHRMCWKLAELGLLERYEDGFSVGTKMFALANTNPIVHELRTAAIPHLVELQGMAGASNLAILTGGKALIIDGLFTRDFRVMPLIGRAVPMHCTAVGKAMLSILEPADRDRLIGRGPLPAATARTIIQPGLIRRHLAQASDAGVAFSHGELRLDTSAVAAGFKLPGGAVAAIGCVGSWNSPAISRSSRAVAEAAASLERDLAHT